MSEGQIEKDNSFIFLEKDTLHLLMGYLLMNTERRNFGEVHEDSQTKMVMALEKIIADNQKDFEEIIMFLKDSP